MDNFFVLKIIDGVKAINKRCYKNGVNIKSTDMVNGKKHGAFVNNRTDDDEPHIKPLDANRNAAAQLFFDMLDHDKKATAEEAVGNEGLKDPKDYKIKELNSKIEEFIGRTSDLSSRLSDISLKYIASKKEVDILTKSLKAAENALVFMREELDAAEGKLYDEENCFPTCAKSCSMLKRAEDNLDLRDCIIENMADDMDELSDKLIRIKREVSEVAE